MPLRFAFLLVAILFFPTLPAAAQCELQVLTGQVSPSHFGNQVTVDGDRLFVSFTGGTPDDKVYYFERQAGTWSEKQVLLEDDDQPLAWYGHGLGVDGDRLVVGSPYDSTLANGAGMAFAYEWDATSGLWVRTQQLLPQAVTWGAFGEAIAIDGNRMAISAQGLETGPTQGGRVYLYEHDGAGWVLTDVLFDERMFFGYSLALEGDRLLVGSPAAFQPVETSHVVEYRHRGEWREVRRIESPNPGYPDLFGGSIELQGDVAVIAARSDNTLSNLSARGAVHIYEGFASDNPRLVQTLYQPEDFSTQRQFGGSLALDGQDLLIQEIGLREHVVHHYAANSGSGWQRQSTLFSPPGPEGDRDADVRFESMAVEGGIAYVGENGLGEDLPQGSVSVIALPTVGVVACVCEAPASCSPSNAGCPNTVGFGAELRACGTRSVASDDLRLQCWGLPDETSTILAMGTATGQQPFDDGFLCVAGALVRLASQGSGEFGAVYFGPGLIEQGNSIGAAHLLLPGSTSHFQVWYRDFPAEICPGTLSLGSNLSDALSITWQL